MSTIHPNLPSLAQSLLSLSAQTKPATSDTGAATQGGGAPAADTLTLSSSQPSTLAEAAAQIAQQNQFAAIADPTEALAANQAAAGFMTSDPDTALQAQGAPDPQVVLGLLGGAD